MFFPLKMSGQKLVTDSVHKAWMCHVLNECGNSLFQVLNTAAGAVTLSYMF